MTGTMRRKGAVLALGAALYALLFALGSQIDETGTTALAATLVRFACALPAALAVLYLLFEKVLPRLALRADAPGARRFCTPLAFAFIFCCYVPMFLVEFPGTYMYDIDSQGWQAVHEAFTTFHPLLHTLLLHGCLKIAETLGSVERSAALCVLIQMAYMAGCFSLVCASVSRSVSRRAAVIAMLFFALYPSHMALACNYTKDGMFAASFALFVALGFEWMHAGGLPRGRMALLVVSGALACMLRNNMIYAMAAWFAVLLLQRRRLLKLALCAALSMALALSANAALVAVTDAEGGSTLEMLSVPIQQLGRARKLAPQRFTLEEAALLGSVMPDELVETYEPTLSDMLKNYMNRDAVNANLGALARLWVSIGMKEPGIYLDAFLNLAHPSLYPYSEYRVAQPYIELGVRRGALTRAYGLPDIVQPRRFEGVRTFIDEHIFSTGADEIPVVRWLFNTGGIYWLLLALMLYDVYSGQWARVTVCALVLLLYATYLLGPVMQGRYLYPFVCALPLFVLRPAEPSRPQKTHGGDVRLKHKGGTDNAI